MLGNAAPRENITYQLALLLWPTPNDTGNRIRQHIICDSESVERLNEMIAWAVGRVVSVYVCVGMKEEESTTLGEEACGLLRLVVIERLIEKCPSIKCYIKAHNWMIALKNNS